MIYNISIEFRKALQGFVVAFFAFNGLLAQQHTPLSAINSPSDELHPVFHPVGDLYFSRVIHTQHANGYDDYGSIWKSSLIPNQGFSDPIKVNDFFTPNFDLLVGFPNDHTAYVFHNQYKGTQGIFVYQLRENLWQLDSMLNIPGLKSQGPIFTARLSQNGNIILMSMQSFGSYGNEDLYVSKWESKSNAWSRPVNLGSTINSSHQELTPYYSEEEGILFFSSNRPGEGAGFQLFYSLRLDDSFTQWSLPMPLTFFDTEGVTLSYMESPQDRSPFFTSTSSSEGYGDIFLLSNEVKQKIYNAVNTNMGALQEVLTAKEIVINEPIDQKDFTVSENIQSPQEVKPKQLTHQEKKQQWISQAASHLSDYSLVGISTSGEILSTVNISATDSIVKTWILRVPGFIPMTVDWEKPFSNDMLLPVERGIRLDLSIIQFPRGSYQLTDSSSIGYIKAFAEFLIASPNVKIGLEGHTDNLGNVELNKTLSIQRASKIRDLLVEYGVDFERIRVNGFGGTRPIADNKTDAGRILNRRVELVILEN